MYLEELAKAWGIVVAYSLGVTKALKERRCLEDLFRYEVRGGLVNSGQILHHKLRTLGLAGPGLTRDDHYLWAARKGGIRSGADCKQVSGHNEYVTFNTINVVNKKKYKVSQKIQPKNNKDENILRKIIVSKWTLSEMKKMCLKDSMVNRILQIGKNYNSNQKYNITNLFLLKRYFYLYVYHWLPYNNKYFLTVTFITFNFKTSYYMWVTLSEFKSKQKKWTFGQIWHIYFLWYVRVYWFILKKLLYATLGWGIVSTQQSCVGTVFFTGFQCGNLANFNTRLDVLVGQIEYS